MQSVARNITDMNHWQHNSTHSSRKRRTSPVVLQVDSVHESHSSQYFLASDSTTRTRTKTTRTQTIRTRTRHKRTRLQWTHLHQRSVLWLDPRRLDLDSTQEDSTWTRPKKTRPGLDPRGLRSATLGHFDVPRTGQSLDRGPFRLQVLLHGTVFQWAFAS